MPKMSADTRATAGVRFLRVGDAFSDMDDVEQKGYEVTAWPEIDGNWVKIRAKRPGGRRSFEYFYSWDARVNIVRT